jgi:hypothetical protein
MIQTPAALPLDAPDTYPFPKSRDHLMPWSRAEQLLAEASVYWLLTVHPDGRPADSQGILRLRPRAVRAWGETMQDATRWRFDL